MRNQFNNWLRKYDEETDMSHYCGIDLHSNNHVVVVIDDGVKRVYEKRWGLSGH